MTDWDRSSGASAAHERGAPVFLQVGAGILLVPVLHLAAGLLLAGLVAAVDALGPTAASAAEVLPAFGMMFVFGIGLGQLAYVVPVAVALAFVRRPVALGVVIGAALTLALNSACFGLLLSTGFLDGL